MKNTVKKILALVFVVAMVCSLAVPVFAADVKATVVFVPYDLEDAIVKQDVTLKDTKANLYLALSEADELNNAYALTFSKGMLSGVAITGETITENEVPGKFETAKWVVALNGKIVSEDLRTVSYKANDVISIYLYEGTFATKFVQYDDSNIEAGIISFYYYDLEGNKKPLTNATVELDVKNLMKVVSTETLASGETAGVDTYGMPSTNEYGFEFATDEKGQIWVAPQFLGNASITIKSVTMDTEPKTQDKTDYDDITDYNYYYDNFARHYEARQVADSTVKTENMYIVAGATGDMTVVYVMVAAAAVITLGAVVIMKKKAVKAN